MIQKKYFQKIRTELLAYAEKRREVIKSSGDAQHSAKRAIFALQRDDRKEAEECLSEAASLLTGLNKRYHRSPELFEEGSYRAGLEEYVESWLFYQFLIGKEIGEIDNLTVDPDLYISGLADVPGEVLRYAIKSATERNFLMVKKCYQVAEMIVSEMVDMDLTGYNRQKFDQAKQALNKLQQVVYEVSLRN
jgi:predicted translin family RNA/ssDNA-binding protein